MSQLEEVEVNKGFATSLLTFISCGYSHLICIAVARRCSIFNPRSIDNEKPDQYDSATCNGSVFQISRSEYAYLE